jgi:hypothetical protein
MKVDEERRQLVTELNEFVKTLDENVREAAFKFLLGQSSGVVEAPPTAAAMAPSRMLDDREISPQELIRQSNAKSGMAKAEVLGYWMEVHQAKQSFSSGDLKDAFAQAREPSPKNLSDVAAKLASSGKLMPAERSGSIQYYRLTRTAIDEVASWLQHAGGGAATT